MNEVLHLVLKRLGGSSGSRGRGRGGWRWCVAHPDTGAHLGRVEVVVDEAADDVRELGLYQGLTESLQSGVNGAQSRTQPLNKVDDVIHSLVAGQPLVDVSDDVNTDVAKEILRLLVGGVGHAQEEQEREDLEHDDGFCERNSRVELTACYLQ